MMNNMDYMKDITERKEYKKDINNTYNRKNIWGRDRSDSKKYWSEHSRIFNFGYSNCELGRDFWDINEYINEHSGFDSQF